MTIPFWSFDKSALSFFSYDITKKKFKVESENMWSQFFLKFLNFSCNFMQFSWIGCQKCFSKLVYWVSVVVRQLYPTSNWEARVQIPAWKKFLSFFFNLKCIRVQIPVPIDIFHKEFISIWYVIVLISSKLAMLKVTTGYKLGLSYLVFIYFYWIPEPVEL